MIFRQAHSNDIPQIQVVRNRVLENPLPDPSLVTDADCKDYLNRRGRGWVCEIEGLVVGFSIVSIVDKNVWALFVDPVHERKGIGRQLHDLMMEWYFSQSNHTIWLGTAPGTRAERFYLAAGWIQKGIRSNGEVRFEMSAKDWKSMKDITCNHDVIQFPEFRTARLLIRPLYLSDEAEIFQLRSDDQVNRFLDRERASTVDDARKFINKIHGLTNTNELFYWAIAPLNSTKLVGTICLFDRNEQEASIELGYELLPSSQQRGYMSEAADKIIQFAFTLPGIRQVVAVSDRANLSSTKLLKKLNFTEDDQVEKDSALIRYKQTRTR